MEMLTHSKALWRIEYKADLTRSDSKVLPLAFALEARWSNDVRWLGMLFRKRLSPLEGGLVDFGTWPELKDMDKFMENLFETIWQLDLPEDGERPELGSALIARNYTGYGSLAFVLDDPGIDLRNDDPEQSFTHLYGRLLEQHDRLSPAILAPVIAMPKRGKRDPIPAAPRVDVEQVMRAA
jgi:hypothetical protein